MKKLELGQIVKLKKKHPCGSNEWKITRVGTDIKAECQGCGHEILIPRLKFLKLIKE